jgi:hypothetical protein
MVEENEWGGVKTTPFVSKHVKIIEVGQNPPVKPTPLAPKMVGWCQNHASCVENHRKRVTWGLTHPVRIETRRKRVGWG